MTNLEKLARLENDEEIIQAVRQWVETFVVGMNLCPFAKRELVKKRVRFVTTAATTAEQLLQVLQTELELLNADPSVETTLLIHPAVLQDFYDFNDFLGCADSLLWIWNWKASTSWPVFILIISLAARGQVMRKTTPIVRHIQYCTCCVKRVWSV